MSVSLEEAKRLEKETVARLQSSRKLCLVVDLDQTLVHASMDPIIEEWIKNPDANLPSHSPLVEENDAILNKNHFRTELPSNANNLSNHREDNDNPHSLNHLSQETNLNDPVLQKYRRWCHSVIHKAILSDHPSPHYIKLR